MIYLVLQFTLCSNIFRNESNFVQYFSINVSDIRKFQVALKVFKALTEKITFMGGEHDIVSQKTFLFSDECAFMK